MIRTIKDVSKSWEVSFQVKLFGVSSKKTSVVHVSKGKNINGLPAIFFNKKTSTLHICSNINGKLNNCYDTKPLELNEYSTIRIQQKHSAYGIHHYTIKVNGKLVFKIDNTKAVESGDVNLYAGNPLDKAAPAHLNDLEFKKLPEGYPLKKKTLIKKGITMYKVFHLSFDIEPTGNVPKQYGSIIHVTTGDDNKKYGDRIPGAWFRPDSQKLYICSAINDQKDTCYKAEEDLPSKKFTRVAINQSKIDGKSYTYTIRVNDKIVFTRTNKKAKVFKDVKLYAADKWYPAAIANIKNILLISYKPEEIEEW